MVVIQFVRYKLVSEERLSDFLLAQKKVLEVFVKKQKGFICWESCLDNKQNIRADILHWDCLEDMKNAQILFSSCDEAKKMMSFISSESVVSLDFNSVHNWDKF